MNPDNIYNQTRLNSFSKKHKIKYEHNNRIGIRLFVTISFSSKEGIIQLWNYALKVLRGRNFEVGLCGFSNRLDFENFRENGQNLRNPRNLIPTKMYPIKVLQKYVF